MDLVISPAMEATALVLTFLVHVLAAGVLIYNLIDREDGERGSWRDWWPRDRDDDPLGPDAPPAGDGGLISLPPDAAPSGVRLREPGRLGDRRPAPARRPAHAPERVPDRERVR